MYLKILLIIIVAYLLFSKYVKYDTNKYICIYIFFYSIGNAKFEFSVEI